MIVRENMRRAGVGSLLMARVEAWARGQGFAQAWVATGGPAVHFYRACGWQLSETLQRAHEETAILTKQL